MEYPQPWASMKLSNKEPLRTPYLGISGIIRHGFQIRQLRVDSPPYPHPVIDRLPQGRPALVLQGTSILYPRFLWNCKCHFGSITGFAVILPWYYEIHDLALWLKKRWYQIVNFSSITRGLGWGANKYDLFFGLGLSVSTTPYYVSIQDLLSPH